MSRPQGEEARQQLEHGVTGRERGQDGSNMTGLTGGLASSSGRTGGVSDLSGGKTGGLSDITGGESEASAAAAKPADPEAGKTGGLKDLVGGATGGLGDITGGPSSEGLGGLTGGATGGFSDLIGGATGGAKDAGFDRPDGQKH